MDLSSEYVNMCRAAKEIQEHEPGVGDYVIHEKDRTDYPENVKIIGEYLKFGSPNNYKLVTFEGIEIATSSPINEYVWLPTQDQLQDMYPLGWTKYDERCRKIYNKWSVLTGRNDFTKEQIGLMVVMKDICHKEWNGTEWITL